MNDMSSVIVPKSDQINADDLIAGPMTITIREVQIRGGQEQPVSIYFDGSDKAFRPCKSMSRVLVQGWGADANKYVGRSLTLYRDPTVKWAGLEVGGIRISHMSHIDGEKLMMLTATKGSRKPHKVKPLQVEQRHEQDNGDAQAWAGKFIANVNRAPDVDKLNAYVASRQSQLSGLGQSNSALRQDCQAAVASRIAELTAAGAMDDDNPFGEALEEQTDEPDADTLSPAEQYLAGIRERIEGATDKAALKKVDDDFNNNRVAYDDEVANEIDGLIAAKRKALAGGEG